MGEIMSRILSVTLAAGIAVSLAGCTTTKALNRALQYPQKPTSVVMQDDTYRVFEIASEKTLMTTTSFGKAISGGAARGATLGLAQTFTPEQLHQAAAQQYLVETGREECTITSGYLLLQPQYEFTYQCLEQKKPPVAG
tara:strand:- start:32207 stop:32623 length:417 start_codon:yes stop_codon:yes gene_type:complete